MARKTGAIGGWVGPGALEKGSQARVRTNEGEGRKKKREKVSEGGEGVGSSRSLEGVSSGVERGEVWVGWVNKSEGR